MKLSFKGLNDYVDVSDFFKQTEKLGDLLTRAGLELESIEDQSARFNNVVIGKIQKLEKHENADKLTVCQVDVGAAQPQQIVCGAKNHKQGDYVVAALPGAVLPGNFVIKKSKIRGVESLGMLCSKKELGLAEDSEGILTMDSGEVGESFAQAFGLKDVIYEISVTPNRADCLSHVGLARELACLLGKPWKFDEPKVTTSKDSVKDVINLSVLQKEMCPRYAGRLIRGVNIGESPAWLKQRLEAVEINSINNVVDATNFVMLELGQPLHAFDLKELSNGIIQVDKSKPKEKFKTLDATEIELTGEELTIRDGDRPVALAGIVGGLNSGVNDTTTDLFVEAAYFNPKTVRSTSRKFGIDTDSGYRFSRGVDPEGVVLAMNRACELIIQLAGGKASVDFYDEYPAPIEQKTIEVSQSFIEQKMGYSIQADEFEEWMKRLGCEVAGDSTLWKIKAPLFRHDLFRDVDLVEEFARLHGYENIPEKLPVLTDEPTLHDIQYLKERAVELALSSEGHLQAMNYHFINDIEQKNVMGEVSVLNQLGLKTSASPVMVKNPLSEDVNSMRVSLIPGLLKNLVHNVRHSNFLGRVYEYGACFSGANEGGFEQYYNMAFINWGQPEGLWDKQQARPVVYDLKTTIENALKRLNISGYEWRKPDVSPEFLHPGQWSALYLRGKNVGCMGSLHPNLLKKHKIRQDVAVAEFDFESLTAAFSGWQNFKPISKFPAVERDLAFVIPKSMNSLEVEKQIKKSAGKSLRSIRAFDVYQGERIAEDEKSVTFKLYYQEDTKTLEEEELSLLQQKIIEGVTQKLKVRVR